MLRRLLGLLAGVQLSLGLAQLLAPAALALQLGLLCAQGSFINSQLLGLRLQLGTLLFA